MTRTAFALALAAAFLGAAELHAGHYPLWTRVSYAGSANIVTVATADFNGDGRPDVIARRNAPLDVQLFLTAADGTLGAAATVYTTTTPMTDLLVADATGDGKPDVLLMNNANALLVLPSNGDGTFAAPITTTLPFIPGKSAAADFTGDGKVDVLARGQTESVVALYAGDGAGGFSLVASRTLASAPRMVEAADIDADGNADFVIGYSDSTPYQVYYGHGDGSFENPLEVGSLPSSATRLLAADLDADGDRELFVLHFLTNTLTIALNDGGRAFASPVAYSVLPPAPHLSGPPVDLAVADFNGDGHADVAVTVNNDRALATFTGTGSGSLNSPVFVYVGSTPAGSSSPPRFLAAADFDGDGRPDLAITGTISLAVWRNVSGDLSITLGSDTPTITAGQTATFRLTVQTAQGSFSAPVEPPAPTGTVTLKRGEIELGTFPIQCCETMEVAGIPLGTHAVTAHYAGDGSYRAAVSPPAEQRVVAEAVTVTLTSSAAGREVPYREAFHVSASVTSPLAGSLDGRLELYVDGVAVNQFGTGPQHSWTFTDLLPGTHTFRAVFQGTATQPPGESAVITQVVKKAASILTFEYGSGDQLMAYSGQSPIRMFLSGHDGGTLGGNVHLWAGLTRIATAVAPPDSGTQAVFAVTLPVGVHYLHATYDGDANFEPSQTAVKKYTVLADQGFVIHGSMAGSTITIRSAYAMPGGTYCRVHWRVGSGTWNSAVTASPSWNEPQAPVNVPYTVFMEIYTSSHQLVVKSNTEVVMRASFTDDPLPVRTRIKARHLTELVEAVNTMRAAAGLLPIEVLGIAPGARIRSAHLLQIQTAVNDARRALGGDAVAFSGGIDSRTRIKAGHLLQTREAIR